MQEQGRTPGLLNKDISITQTPSSNASRERPGPTMPQGAEHPPQFDPYNCQYQGPGVNMGTHLSHNLGQVPHQIPLYTSSSDSIYTWQGDGAGSGYWGLYSPLTPSHPHWSGRSFGDQATESLHASIAWILTEVKGLATHVTSLSESEAKLSERTNQILTCFEEIEAWVKVVKGAAGEGSGVHAK